MRVQLTYPRVWLLFLLVSVQAALYAVPEVSNPQMVFDPSGDAVAVWQDNGGLFPTIRAADFSFGGSWSAATTISTLLFDNINPVLSVNSLGNAIAMWLVEDPINVISLLQVATRPSGGSWSLPVTISAVGENVVNFSVSPLRPSYSVAINSANQVVAVWTTRLLGGDVVVRSASSSFGGVWTAPVQVSP